MIKFRKKKRILSFSKIVNLVMAQKEDIKKEIELNSKTLIPKSPRNQQKSPKNRDCSKRGSTFGNYVG